MRFSVEHTFAAPRGAVASILCDPEFHRKLVLPDLGLPEILENAADGAVRHLRMRYEFVGDLDPVARKLLAGRRLTWLQDVRLDLTTAAGTLSFAAEADADRLYGTADVALDAIGTDGSGTRRRISGELHVRVPLVGGSAERRIVPGLVRRLDVEAAAVVVQLGVTP